MNRGFNTILAAQFLSSLGDNALLFAAIALLKNLDTPSWQIPVLQQCFVFAFIVLTPFVGVQNFNENLSNLLMLEAELSVHAIVVVFGLFLPFTMAWLTKKHGHDQDE